MNQPATRTAAAEPESKVRPGSQFASDNCAGICPQAMQALVEANQGHVSGYGDDHYTTRASDLLRELFEIDCEVFFVFNGTAANSLSIGHLCKSYHSVICHEKAHVETDECGGPEFFTHGTKLLLSRGEQGKVTPDDIEEIVTRRTDIHYPKPRVVSVTQSTELGTVYSVQELDAIREAARRHKLRVHMDGARFANAVASLGVPPKETTWKVGVDVLCFGGTKNGMPFGEAVVFFNRDLAAEFDYRCKQAGQLNSKMRFTAAPWIHMIEDDNWLKHARHANACAQKLADGLDALGVSLIGQPQANAVFAQFEQAWIDAMHQRGWHFYTFIGEGGVRLMCSWATKQEEIEAFLRDLSNVCK
jgi:threonine aldolase